MCAGMASFPAFQDRQASNFPVSRYRGRSLIPPFSQAGAFKVLANIASFGFRPKRTLV